MDIQELLDNFALLPGWEERYAYVIDLGRQLPPMDAGLKNPQTKVEGCMSQVWLLARPDPARPRAIEYLGDSDAHIVKGLVAVLLAVYSHKTPEEISAIDIQDIFNRLGLGEHLSPNRRNGFYAMVDRIKTSAARLAA